MTVRPYTSGDLAEIARWHLARGRAGPSAGTLPPTGYVVDGAACGFLLLTDAPSVALIDGVATCPEALVRVRWRAVGAILERLMEDARKAGVTRIFGFTAARGMERLTARQGFARGGRYRLVSKGV